MSEKVLFGAVIGLILIWMIPAVYAEGDFQISFSCVNCHQERYYEWSSSMHALAVNDPIFEAAYLRAYQSDPKYRSYCLTCHSPTTRVTKDFNLTASISVEGVSCSFCHTVTGVENNSYNFSQNNPMQGPYKDSKTDAHASAYSELHTKSEFCAGCHDFSINDVPISQTYTEWKESSYASEGKQCQDCHMETKTGAAAKNGTLREKVYQHFWYGGHAGQSLHLWNYSEQATSITYGGRTNQFLQNVFQINSSIQRTGNRVRVTLNITNNNVGHMIPSGLPSRKVVLDFGASDNQGQEIYSAQKVYAKTIVDQYNNEVYDFWKAVAVAKDNRFKPKESRIEVFEFDAPKGIDEINIHASLTYQLEAEVITTETKSVNVELASVSNRTIINNTAAVQAQPKGSPAVGWMGSIIAIIAAVLLIRTVESRGRHVI
jgi:nitrate/TMAO reductase-like tetraheme cytochrome c subunit